MLINLQNKGGKKILSGGAICEDDIIVVPKLQNKTVTANGTHKADNGYTGLNEVTVNVEGGETIPDGYIKPSGTKPITTNGTHDVKAFESVEVNVPTSGGSGEVSVYVPKTVPVTGTYQFNENIVETGAFILDETTVETYGENYLGAVSGSVIEAKESGNTLYILPISMNLDGQQAYMVTSFVNREMTESDETLYQFAYGMVLLNELSNRTFEIVDSGAFGAWVLANATKQS